MNYQQFRFSSPHNKIIFCRSVCAKLHFKPGWFLCAVLYLFICQFYPLKHNHLINTLIRNKHPHTHTHTHVPFYGHSTWKEYQEGSRPTWVSRSKKQLLIIILVTTLKRRVGLIFFLLLSFIWLWISVIFEFALNFGIRFHIVMYSC